MRLCDNSQVLVPCILLYIERFCVVYSALRSRSTTKPGGPMGNKYQSIDFECVFESYIVQKKWRLIWQFFFDPRRRYKFRPPNVFLFLSPIVHLSTTSSSTIFFLNSLLPPNSSPSSPFFLITLLESYILLHHSIVLLIGALSQLSSHQMAGQSSRIDHPVLSK
jgi:hypothetical protein